MRTLSSLSLPRPRTERHNYFLTRVRSLTTLLARRRMWLQTRLCVYVGDGGPAVVGRTREELGRRRGIGSPYSNVFGGAGWWMRWRANGHDNEAGEMFIR